MNELTRMYRYFFAITFLVCTAFSSSAQSSFDDNPEIAGLLKKGVDYIYNADLENFNRVAEQVNQKMPNHPVYPMLKAMAIRTAYYPIEVSSPEFEQMRAHLEEVVNRAEVILEEDEDQPVANFFALASLGLLAMYENDAGNSFKAVGYAKEAYNYLKTGFELKEKYDEFYFSTGLYNYYRVKFPELHPIYKTFTWFFRDGDLAQGLQQLDLAYRRSVFMRPEAASYLTHIYLHYEDQPLKALPYVRQMVRSYPNNLSFNVGYLEAAIAAGKYDNLDFYVNQLKGSEKAYFQMTGHLFEAALLEKKEAQWEKAEDAYLKALTIGNQLSSDEARHFRSYTYAGLARIAISKGAPGAARKLYQDALSEARYPPLKEEAEAYLD